ncbi:SUF system NifU family Fe-S cluster assembly protein [Cocleimonas sp. KMM 6892]|uniref:Fe-S cluster assembly sulfur transfer protein SufU n=1 Tax=unclassified Cocleimonas TaxID=2639732 RepID=UPI002DBBF662|nr:MULTISPECIES: SUF system NifU family Fe-S cluster assembly protein [unclassified Cocleimonas]MEB8432630.1 SUF system NifU family Fe-S cluster assembly protein [Cocleimonas sp. KMM 6892]MEC4715489.1 SUF system NifU family Fe-S cluster assembly protein [Cocleimonas sp. KMM 6895]MEC4744893.1 SUF system NifU family Fe-S cluster assembly protein [Cocleimonas sp. KMM 6896]
MTTNTVYKEVLMDHYRNPRNFSDVSQSEAVHRGSNPRCGDDIKIGVDFDGDNIGKIVFQGRGCSVCMASASMMTESVTGASKNDVLELTEQLREWFDEKQGDTPAPLETLFALDALRQYPARRRCVLLAWDALESIIQVE